MQRVLYGGVGGKIKENSVSLLDAERSGVSVYEHNVVLSSELRVDPGSVRSSNLANERFALRALRGRMVVLDLLDLIPR